MKEFADVLCCNLKLLNFDFTAAGIPSEPIALCTFFRYPRKNEFSILMQFLFRAADPVQFEQLISSIGSQTNEIVVRNALQKWLRTVRSRIRLPVTFFRVWGSPAGVGLLHFLVVVSKFALESVYNIPPDLENIPMDRFETVLNRFRTNDTVLNCLTRELETFRDQLTERRRINLSESIANLMTSIREKNVRSELDPALSGDQSSTREQLLAVQNLVRKLSEEVSTRRQAILARISPHAVAHQDLRHILSALDQDIPVLDGAAFKAAYLPSMIASELGNEKLIPIRDGDKVDLHRLIKAMNVLFTLGCKILHCHVPTGSHLPTDTIALCCDPDAPDTTQSDSVASMCLRMFQRGARQLQSQPVRDQLALCSSSTDLDLSNVSTSLDRLIGQMEKSIRALQPNIEDVLPKRDDTETIWSQICTPHSTPNHTLGTYVSVQSDKENTPPPDHRTHNCSSSTNSTRQNLMAESSMVFSPPVCQQTSSLMQTTESPIRSTFERLSLRGDSSPLSTTEWESALPVQSTNVSRTQEPTPKRQILRSVIDPSLAAGHTNPTALSESPVKVKRSSGFHVVDSSHANLPPFLFQAARASDEIDSNLVVHRDDQVEEFDLLGDSLDFINDLVPSSPS